MMNDYENLIKQNKSWSEEKIASDKNFFDRLAAQQKPKFFWIGCSDSRVPANQITGTAPGEIFVHRNIANVIVHTDLNFLSVLQYAVEILEVEHIIVCGHYGCGGVEAALTNNNYGLINKWLKDIKEVYKVHQAEIDCIPTHEGRVDKLVEFNVIEQCQDLITTSIIQKSWKNRKAPIIHGWAYGLNNGLVKELVNLEPDFEQIHPIYRFDLDQLNS
jgi:carbonic anhydrase